MRVLVVDPCQTKREALTRALDPARFRVDTAGDAKAALAAMARAMPHVLLVGWPATAGRELVQILRGADTTGRLYVVAVLDHPVTPCQLRAMISVGVAHDFIQLPASPEEIAARADGPRRLATWAQALVQSETSDWTGGMDIQRLGAWEEMGSIVADEIGKVLELPVHAASGWPVAFRGTLRAGTLALSLGAEQIELRLSIATDDTGARALSEILLGNPTPDEEVVADVLRELANSAAGAVKRASLPDDVMWTTGLPVNESVTLLRSEGARCWTVTLPDGVALVVLGELAERANQCVPAKKLREGMVVVRDLRNDAGALLVPAGTRLTSTSAERVARLLDSRVTIEVAFDPGGARAA